VFHWCSSLLPAPESSVCFFQGGRSVVLAVYFHDVSRHHTLKAMMTMMMMMIMMMMLMLMIMVMIMIF
jgi:hypothetical protein